MSVGNIDDYSSVLQNYSVPVIPAGDRILSGMQLRTESMVQTEESPVTHESSGAESVQRKNTPLEDVFVTFNLQEDFEYIGRDSDILSVDVEKAISDMQKDQVLRQYQYFVESAEDLFSEGADGAVLRLLQPT